MRPQVFLVTVTVESLEPADLASVLSPALRFAVNLHVTSQIDPVSERFMTDVAGARFIVTVHAHVRFQSRLQVKPLVAHIAEFSELLVVSPNVNLQVIFGRQFGVAHVTNVRRPVQRFVNIQILLLLKNLVTHVTFYRVARSSSLLLVLPFFRLRRFILRFVLFTVSRGRSLAPASSMFEQLYFLRETLAALVARVPSSRFSQRLASSKDRPLGSVNQQSSLRIELLIAGLASMRYRLDDAGVIYFVDNDKRSIFLVGRFSGARLIPLGCYRLHAFRSAKRQQSVSCLEVGRLHARNEDAIKVMQFCFS